jgi:L-asparaginase
MQFDAFESGNYPPLAKAGVKINYNHSAIYRTPSVKLKLHTVFDTNVAILKLFPGISESVVKAILSIKGLKGVILETYGSGNAPNEPWLIDALSDAVMNGLILLNVSQCPGGMVIQGRYETSKALSRIGIIGGSDMTTEAALTKLMVLLGEYSVEETRKRIGVSISGEMSN